MIFVNQPGCVEHTWTPDGSVALAIAIPTPDFGAVGPAVAAVLAEVMSLGTANDTRSELWRYGAQDGVGPIVTQLPGMIVIAVQATGEGAHEVCVDVGKSILTEPEIFPDRVDEAKGRLAALRRQAWIAASWPMPPAIESVTPAQVQLAHQIWVRSKPLAVWLGTSTGVGAQALSAEEFGTERIKPGATSAATLPAGYPAWRWDLPVIGPGPDLAATTAATALLGLGKDSFGFRVLRSEQQLGYLIQGGIFPDPKGWAARLTGLGRTELPTGYLDWLEAERLGWTEARIGLGKRWVRAANAGIHPFPLFWVSRTRTLDGTGATAAVWSAWNSALGVDLHPGILDSTLENIEAEDVQAALGLQR